MKLFGGVISVTGVSFLIFTVFAIAAVGYLLGRIKIKGVALGTAGVFIVALIYGCFLYNPLAEQLVVKTSGGEAVTFVSSSLKTVETLGLILFVTAVGFIAGPNFFGNFKKNFKSYVLIAVIIILIGGLTCAGCIMLDNKVVNADKPMSESTAMLVGLLSGSLTSTPAFSAAKETVKTISEELEAIVSVGHGIAYLFGVVGVVLFVQIMPKIAKADLPKERELLKAEGAKDDKKKKYDKKLIEIDEFGFMPFALAAILGIFIGSIKIGQFSLTSTGGCLLTSLLFGHFARIGRISITPSEKALKVFRELGLMLFLIGAGVSGGASFVKYFQWVYFLYGIVMTILPMIVGYIFAKYVLKLRILNNLGSITGGMTSTPALGTLINTAGTEDVASAYAATYPVALVSVVLISEVLILIFK